VILLRQVEVQRVLGRRLLEKLVRTGTIAPIQANGGSGIFFDAYKLHRALSRIQRGGSLNGPPSETTPKREKYKNSRLMRFSQTSRGTIFRPANIPVYFGGPDMDSGPVIFKGKAGAPSARCPSGVVGGPARVANFFEPVSDVVLRSTNRECVLYGGGSPIAITS
jgi:hypothetical protein